VSKGISVRNYIQTKDITKTWIGRSVRIFDAVEIYMGEVKMGAESGRLTSTRRAANNVNCQAPLHVIDAANFVSKLDLVPTCSDQNPSACFDLSSTAMGSTL
jgi:hypothetical protein